MGSLQAVKESLLRMRCHRDRDRSSAAPSASVSAASISARVVPMQSPQQDDSSRITSVASEMIRYMLDDEDLTASSLVVGDKTTSSGSEAVTSSDPCVVSTALQHQQLRAEVLTH